MLKGNSSVAALAVLALVGASGSAPAASRAPFDRNAAWSPDGTRIALASVRGCS